MHDCTYYTWSYFFKKSEIPDKVNELVKELKAKYNIQVRKIPCDSTVQNHAVEALCKKEGNGVTFEYIVPGTPQQNGQAEQKFAILLG